MNHPGGLKLKRNPRVLGLLAMFLALVFAPLALAHSHHTPPTPRALGARHDASDIARRAALISRALFTDPQIGAPEFYWEAITTRPERPLWLVRVVADGHNFDLLFNDRTGNLNSLFGTNTPYGQPQTGPRLINNSGQAFQLALARLQELQALPTDSRVTLLSGPDPYDNGRCWRVVFNLRRPGVPLHEVRIALESGSGLPLIMADDYELSDPR